MLDQNNLLRVPDVPGVQVYADHADPTRFYAIPDAPRVARNDNGTPALSLLAYGRGSGPDLQLLGGQVQLTLTLALTGSERQTLTAALEESLNRHQPREAPPVRVTLLSPEWLTGQVHADLLPGLTLTGHPSLMAANECVLSATLTPQQATDLQRAWAKGLPDARLRYEVTTPAAQTEVSHKASTSAEPLRTFSVSFTARTTRTLSTSLCLEGPLSVSPSELQGALQVTSF
ncbi:hypothetical protein GO986_06720 [Deinococcus sp. HMF7620]|uniref:Uncharacterized protein n=1 Tax=Deinococcus arboris TaxID=2682977 RepID=A0A7C9HYW1_9DEIO|nr:hypothetical protein [Deinococcus arboris]MVN86455.1 hypothetical protein [Deinococcus arboris]